jgi:hypothetical protein
MFDTREEAAMRLDGTIIQGPNGPVYVKTMETNSRIVYREFRKLGGLSNSSKTCELDEGFCIKPFPLGYMNRGDACYYMQRMPVRKYKQGLYDGALRVVINGEGAQGLRNKTPFLYEGEGFYNMFMGKYPSLIDVKHLLKTGDYKSQAFAREWCLGRWDDKTYALYYKGRYVGTYDKASGVFTLEEHRKYLQEALMEVII